MSVRVCMCVFTGDLFSLRRAKIVQMCAAHVFWKGKPPRRLMPHTFALSVYACMSKLQDQGCARRHASSSSMSAVPCSQTEKSQAMFCLSADGRPRLLARTVPGTGLQPRRAPMSRLHRRLDYPNDPDVGCIDRSGLDLVCRIRILEHARVKKQVVVSSHPR